MSGLCLSMFCHGPVMPKPIKLNPFTPKHTNFYFSFQNNLDYHSLIIQGIKVSTKVWEGFIFLNFLQSFFHQKFLWGKVEKKFLLVPKSKQEMRQCEWVIIHDFCCKTLNYLLEIVLIIWSVHINFLKVTQWFLFQYV